MKEVDLTTVVTIENQNQYTPWTHEQFLDSLKTDVCWVLEDIEKNILGYIVFKNIIDEIELLTIGVATGHWRKGYGKILLQALIDEARKSDKTSVFLEVRRSNQAAIHLYESCGFLQVGLRKNYYCTQAGREDALVYSCVMDAE